MWYVFQNRLQTTDFSILWIQLKMYSTLAYSFIKSEYNNKSYDFGFDGSGSCRQNRLINFQSKVNQRKFTPSHTGQRFFISWVASGGFHSLSFIVKQP